MDEKTKALAEAAEKRAEAATPGVWKQFGMAVMADVDGTSDAVTAIPVARTHYRNADGHPRTNDATFIAAARSDVPALCAALREQDAEIEQTKASLLTALRSVAPEVAFLSSERNVVDLANLACAWIEGTKQRLARSDPPVRTSSLRSECARCCKPLYDMVVGAPDSAHCMCG